MTGRALLIAAAAWIVGAILVFFFLVSPKMGEVSDAREQLEQAQAEEVARRAELSRLQELRQDAPDIRRQLKDIQDQVPPQADLPGLINLLQDAADDSGVEFFSISPGDPVGVPAGAAEIPAQVQVIGRFFPVDEFLTELETLERAAKVTNLTISEGEDGLPQIQAQMAVEFYTTDLNAGPATPGEEEVAPAESPAAEPSPAASPG